MTVSAADDSPTANVSYCRRFTRAARLALVLVFVAAVGACGGGDNGGSDAERVLDDGPSTTTVAENQAKARTPPWEILSGASEKTRAARSARMSMTVQARGSESFRFTGEGVFAFTEPRGHMTMDLSSAGVRGLEGEIEMVFIGNVIYMKFPFEDPSLGGASWGKIDMAQLGVDFEELQQFGSSDPSQALELLRGASDDVTEVGEEKVRGVETTHYEAVVDTNKALEQLPENARDRLLRFTKELPSELPMHVWVDDEGLLRKMRMEMDASRFAPEGEDPGLDTMTMDMELYDFGVEVDVTAPPEEDTADLTERVGEQLPRD